jgi:hypothetical protein
VFADKLPAVYAAFEDERCDIRVLTLEWFMCAYVNVLPMETAMRVWDIMFLERSNLVLFQVALALLHSRGEEYLAAARAKPPLRARLGTLRQQMTRKIHKGAAKERGAGSNDEEAEGAEGESLFHAIQGCGRHMHDVERLFLYAFGEPTLSQPFGTSPIVTAEEVDALRPEMRREVLAEKVALDERRKRFAAARSTAGDSLVAGKSSQGTEASH